MRRRLDDAAAEASDRATLTLHAPNEVVLCSDEVLVCAAPGCLEPWPCTKYRRAEDRWNARQRARWEDMNR